MAGTGEHWQTIDAFLAAGVSPSYLEAHPDVVAAASAGQSATPAPSATPAAPASPATSPATPAAPSSAPSTPSTPAPSSTPAKPVRRLPFPQERAQTYALFRRGTRQLAAAPRPGGIGPLVAALLVALIVVIPVALGKSRLQHLIAVLTGEEVLITANPSNSGTGAVADVAAVDPAIGGGVDQSAPPLQPAYKAALPYLPHTGRGLGGSKQWQV